jgi:hypothetical protein
MPKLLQLTRVDEFIIDRIRRPVLRSASSTFLSDIQSEWKTSGLAAAVKSRRPETLFRWLMAVLNYQGISDRVAAQYMRDHGAFQHRAVRGVVAQPLACAKLQSYWHYEDCGYRKAAGICSVPAALAGCKMPALPGRNGRLNQTAISLYLFIRDVADGDLLAWIESELQAHSDRPASERARHLVDAMRSIFGVADKLLCMALSSLLLGAGRKNPLWFETGACLIVVDTLVHNFMHRTGIMRACGNEHPFGLRCYEPNGCAAAIELAAAHIDARLFSVDNPHFFPRLIQHALWRFCAYDGLDTCNGNRIADEGPCDNRVCPDFAMCRRLPLLKAKKRQKTPVFAGS